MRPFPESGIILEPDLRIEDAIEFLVWGSNNQGECYPLLHFFASGADVVLKQYRATYPRVCHVNMDMALPMDEKNS